MHGPPPGDQTPDGRRDALAAAGAVRIFADTIAGAARIRPDLDRLPGKRRTGDVVVVTLYDRLARSRKDLLEIFDLIQAPGRRSPVPCRGHRTTSPAGRRVFHAVASIAQVRVRTDQGGARAPRRGKVGSRPPALSPGQRVEVKRMRDVGRRPIPEIAALLRVSDRTIRRVS
ncbi:MAG: recombinase family protein [Alkalilacustris sp.]